MVLMISIPSCEYRCFFLVIKTTISAQCPPSPKIRLALVNLQIYDSKSDFFLIFCSFWSKSGFFLLFLSKKGCFFFAVLRYLAPTKCISRFFILCLGVAPNFSLFFCQAPNSLRAGTRKKTLKN